MLNTVGTYPSQNRDASNKREINNDGITRNRRDVNNNWTPAKAERQKTA